MVRPGSVNTLLPKTLRILHLKNWRSILTVSSELENSISKFKKGVANMHFATPSIRIYAVFVSS